MAWRSCLLPLLALLPVGCGQAQPRVILYCGQDQEFAEDVLRDFTAQSGIQVDLSADTEADKSVSLYERIVRERKHPRCDVFWNGEVLNTVRLQQQGLLLAYASPSAAPFPTWAQAPDHTWHAFAARARVLIINRDRLRPGDYPHSIFTLTEERWRGRVALAKPQFGTTATHAACLFQALGRERAEDFYRQLRPNVAILPGNKDVAIAVAEGRYDVGFTDTDDAFVEKYEKGRNVDIIYPDQETGQIGTLFIPNTVAIIKDGPNADNARKLVDFLLSREVETRLAQGRSAQFPLNPNVEAKPRIDRPAKPMEVDFAKAAADWNQVQTFLRNEFARP